ncbi:hypothetical protein KR009_000943 [Drosophila setifemur]|nr:hypothetical protein KR009_000943 [Drosophila setifemur]
MKSDNYRLIAEVAKRRSLWDTTTPMVDRKGDSMMQWASVSSIMQQDGEESREYYQEVGTKNKLMHHFSVLTCKKRFKGLRDSYRVEVRKIQHKRIRMSNWPYFRSLEFMRHIFDPHRLVPFSPEPFDPETDLSEECDIPRLDDFAIDVDNDDSVDFEIMGDIFKREPTSERNDSSSDRGSLIKQLDCSSAGNKSDLELSPRLISPMYVTPMHRQLPRPPPPSKRSRRRKTSSSYDGPISHGHSSQASAAVAASKDDADYNFLVSLLPHMKSLSNLSNLKFRMETSRILVDLKKEEQPAVVGAGIQGEACLPRPTPVPDSSYTYLPEKPNQYCLSNYSYLNDRAPSPISSSTCVDSSMVECDVKIENEAFL